MSDHLTYEENRGPTSQDRTAEAVDQALQQIKASNKRKRENSDHGGEDPSHPGSKRPSSSNNLNGNHDGGDISRQMYPDPTTAGQDFSALSQHLVRHVGNPNHGLPENSHASSTAAAALAGIMPQLTVPQPTDLSFVSAGSGPEGDRQLDTSFDLGGPDVAANHNVQGSPYHMGGFQGGGGPVPGGREVSNGGGIKPAVGSEEWHKVRRDNHKEGTIAIGKWVDENSGLTDDSGTAAKRNDQRGH